MLTILLFLTLYVLLLLTLNSIIIFFFIVLSLFISLLLHGYFPIAFIFISIYIGSLSIVIYILQLNKNIDSISNNYSISLLQIIIVFNIIIILLNNKIIYSIKPIFNLDKLAYITYCEYPNLLIIVGLLLLLGTWILSSINRIN